MKHAIQWHKDCLANARITLSGYRNQLQRLQESVDNLQADCTARDGQIIEAELRGVTEFDADKFGIRRKP